MRTGLPSEDEATLNVPSGTLILCYVLGSIWAVLERSLRGKDHWWRIYVLRRKAMELGIDAMCPKCWKGIP